MYERVNIPYFQVILFLFLLQADEFPINEKVALQLAGLQAQVALGDPQDGKTEFYADVNLYLPQRIAQTKKQAEWVSDVACSFETFTTIGLCSH